MAAGTAQEDIVKVRANLDNMAIKHRNNDSERLRFFLYFSCTQDAKEYRRQKMNETASSQRAPPDLLGGQSRADRIEVSLNEDIKSKEERKMKQGTRCKRQPCARQGRTAKAK
jgi:hypothetical protein